MPNNYIDPTRRRPVGLSGLRNSDLYGESSTLTPEEIEFLNASRRRTSKINRDAASGSLGSGVYNSPSFYEAQYLDNDDPRNEFGKSMFDDNMMFNATPEGIQDARAENQPWYSKLINGTLKGVITAGTTFVNGTLGLIVGVGQGLVNLADGNPNTGFIEGIWNNSITNTMQQVSDWQEKALPNYYTTTEANSSFDIFSANFWGDKFIKNLGFTIGAFYSGGLYSKALQGVAALSALNGLPRSFAASAIAAVNEGSIEALNNSGDWYNKAVREIEQLDEQDLNQVKQYFANRAAQALAEYQANAGNFTMTVDGRRYVDPALQKYQNTIAQLESEYRTVEQQMANRKKELLDRAKLDRAKMGNVILGENIPILTASYMWQFGKLFANGFKTANRTSKIITASDKSLAEDAGKNVARYAVKSNKAIPYAKGFSNALAEGTEEISQKAAAEIAGNYYSKDLMNYYKAKKDPEAEQETLSWLTSFGEGIAKTMGEASSWEEFLIGSMTGFLGVPVFGRANTQQAYIGRNKSVGIVGGFAGGFQEYSRQQASDKKLVDALNERLQSKEFLNYYQGMIRHNKEQSEMDKAADAGDVFEFNNHEHSQMVSDIAMWDNAGKLDDLRELINSTADAALEDIPSLLEKTAQIASENPKYQENIRKLQSLIDDRDKDIARLTEEKQEAVRAGDTKKANSIDGTLQGKLREINVLQENLQNLLDKKDSYISAFIDENGNPFTEERIRESIEKNRKDVIDTLDHYIEIKNEIDSQTNYRFDNEQLATLTWLKSHKDNWDTRAATMSKEIKEKALSAILQGAQKELDDERTALSKIPEKDKDSDKAKEHQKAIDNLTDVIESITELSGLSNEEFARRLAASPYIGALLSSMLGTAVVQGLVDGMDHKDFDQKLKDIIKCTIASNQYNQKLMEYLLTPEKLKEDMNKADEEMMKEATDRQNNKIVDNIKSTAKTVKQLREALKTLPNSNDILDKLISDEDENISKIAKEYKAISELEEIGLKVLVMPPGTEYSDQSHESVGINAALITFNDIIDNSETLDEAIKKLEEAITKAEENGNKNEKTEDIFEAVVAEKLRKILDDYKEAENAQKEQEKTKNEKKSSNKDEDEDKEPKTRPAGSGKRDMTFGEFLRAYKILEHGRELHPNVLAAIQDELNQNTPLRKALPKEFQYIVDAYENGTLDKLLKEAQGIDAEDDDKEGDKAKEEIDLDTISETLEEMSPEEALRYLESLDLSKLSESDKKNIEKLKKVLKEKIDNPDVSASDDDDSNAESNNSDTSNEPKFRSYGVAAKYIFDALKGVNRRAELNKYSEDIEKRIAELDKLGAFTFVDKGELGKLFKNNPNIKIHYIMPSKGILANSILLAVEFDDKTRRIAKPVNTIEVNGKRYQVVGELGYKSGDTNITAETQYNELVDAIIKERGKVEGDYFVSEKFYNKIKHIYSGRMVKTGEVTEDGETISSDAIQIRPLRKVLNGVKCILGIYYNPSDFRTPGLPHGATRVPLNPNNKNPREGSVWLMTREADGNYYAKALQVARLDPKEYSWQDHKDTPIIKEILECLEIICDSKASISDRVLAKYTLQEQLLYFPENTQILFNKSGVTIIQDGNSYGIKAGTKEEMAENAMNQLANIEEHLRFQIKTADIADEVYLDKLLESDILTTDLMIAHNINASFDLYLNDMDTGKPLVSGDDGTDKTGHTGPVGINPDLAGVTVSIGNKNYTLHEDGKVTFKNKPVTGDVVNEVKLIANIKNKTIKPINGTNVYEGKYQNGNTFVVVKNGNTYTVYRGNEAQERIEKAKKVKENNDKLDAAKRNKRRREEGEDNRPEDEPVLEEMSDDDLEADKISGTFISGSDSSDDTGESEEGKEVKGTPIIGRNGKQESTGGKKTSMTQFKSKTTSKSFRKAFKEVEELFSGDSTSAKLDDLYEKINNNEEWKKQAKAIGNEEDINKAAAMYKELLNKIKCS